MRRRPKALYSDLPGSLAFFGVPLLPVASCVRPQHLARHSNGYYCVQFEGENTYLHRLALRFRLGRSLTKGMEARHACGNSWCANPWDLEEGPPVDNQADQYRHGTRVYGDSHPMTRISETQLVEVRQLIAHGTSDRQIAAQYGVARQTINDIRLGRRRQPIDALRRPNPLEPTPNGRNRPQ